MFPSTDKRCGNNQGGIEKEQQERERWKEVLCKTWTRSSKLLDLLTLATARRNGRTSWNFKEKRSSNSTSRNVTQTREGANVETSSDTCLGVTFVELTSWRKIVDTLICPSMHPQPLHTLLEAEVPQHSVHRRSWLRPPHSNWGTAIGKRVNSQGKRFHSTVVQYCTLCYELSMPMHPRPSKLLNCRYVWYQQLKLGYRTSHL